MCVCVVTVYVCMECGECIYGWCVCGVCGVREMGMCIGCVSLWSLWLKSKTNHGETNQADDSVQSVSSFFGYNMFGLCGNDAKAHTAEICASNGCEDDGLRGR